MVWNSSLFCYQVSSALVTSSSRKFAGRSPSSVNSKEPGDFWNQLVLRASYTRDLPSPFLLENSWPAVVYKTLFRRFAGRKHTDFKVSLPQALVWCNVRREAPLSLRPSVWPWHLPHHCVLDTCLVLCLPHYLLKYVLGELKKASFLLTCLSSCFPYEILSVFWEDLYFTMCLQQFHVKHAEWRDAISLIIINNNRLIKILGSC